MIHNVLLDTGPLVALLDRRDQYHAWVQSKLADISPPLLTCEPVIAEACYLARRTDGGVEPVMELLQRGVVRLGFALDANLAEVASLLQRYDNVPMALADGCLVRMSELVGNCTILTLDSDFRIYRRHRRQKIPLIIPDDE